VAAIEKAVREAKEVAEASNRTAREMVDKAIESLKHYVLGAGENAHTARPADRGVEIAGEALQSAGRVSESAGGADKEAAGDVIRPAPGEPMAGYKPVAPARTPSARASSQSSSAGAAPQPDDDLDASIEALRGAIKGVDGQRDRKAPPSPDEEPAEPQVEPPRKPPRRGSDWPKKVFPG